MSDEDGELPLVIDQSSKDGTEEPAEVEQMETEPPAEEHAPPSPRAMVTAACSSNTDEDKPEPMQVTQSSSTPEVAINIPKTQNTPTAAQNEPQGDSESVPLKKDSLSAGASDAASPELESALAETATADALPSPAKQEQADSAATDNVPADKPSADTAPADETPVGESATESPKTCEMPSVGVAADTSTCTPAGTPAGTPVSTTASTPAGTPANAPAGTPGSTPADTPVGGTPRSRVTRSRNPDFAAKQKSFMKEYHRSVSGTAVAAEAAPDAARPEKRAGSEEVVPAGKRRRHLSRGSEEPQPDTAATAAGAGTLNDNFCWVCHREGQVVCCETCPRVFHLKCAGLTVDPPGDWVCGECRRVVQAETAERRLSPDRLTQLIQYAIGRLKGLPGAEPFLQPVDERKFPTYRDYVGCPMDLATMEQNVNRALYTSTEAFAADCKWILHNCILFNGTASKLTTLAKSLLRMCKWEMEEIETCPDCYGNAYASDNWFTLACPQPHLLIWARLKGFPFWPAKAVKTRDGNVDCRFFGRHDRAWVPAKECFLFSREPPSLPKHRTKSLDACVEELEEHVRNLEKRFGKYNFAKPRTQYDPKRIAAHLKMTLPGYEGPNTQLSPEPSDAKRSNSEIQLEILERLRQGKKARQSGGEPAAAAAAAGPTGPTSPTSPPPPAEVAKSPDTDRPGHTNNTQTSDSDTAEPVKTEPANTETAKAETVRSEAVKTDVVKSEPAETAAVPPAVAAGTRRSESGTTSEEEEVRPRRRTARKSLSAAAAAATTPLVAESPTASPASAAAATPPAATPPAAKPSVVSAGKPAVIGTTTGKALARMGAGSAGKPKVYGGVKKEPAPVTAASASNMSTVMVGKTSKTVTLSGSQAQSPTVRVVTPGTGGAAKTVASSGPGTIQLCRPAPQTKVSSVKNNGVTQQVLAAPLRPKLLNSSGSARPAVPAVSAAPQQSIIVNRAGARLMIPRASLNQLYIPTGPAAGALTTSAQLGPMMVIPGGLGAATNGATTTVVTYPAVSSAVGGGGCGAASTAPAPSTLVAPAEAGPVSALVEKQAQALTDVMRQGVERLLSELAVSGSSAATAASLRLQIERMQWQHKAELAEQKRTADAQIAELQATIAAEQKKAAAKLSSTMAAETKAWERQMELRVAETKKKQWCANCGKEAIFYCCWNTSYCDFPCQEAQWPKHMLTCANQQGNNPAAGDGGGCGGDADTGRLQTV